MEGASESVGDIQEKPHEINARTEQESNEDT